MRDNEGILLKRMEECVDGEYQKFKSKDGAYVRKHFFGKYPKLLEMVADMTDDDIWRLNRGGHDPHKVYAAYAAAMKHKGQPTVILAKTIKGYGMGEAGESQNITHQQKKMGDTSIRAFRDRFAIPVPDDKLEEAPFVNAPEDSPEMQVPARAAEGARRLSCRRAGAKPSRSKVPPLSAFETLLKASGEGREISTTMAFVRDTHDAGARQEDRQVRRADRARRVAHVRHGRHVPPARDLFVTSASCTAAGRRPADVLQGRQEGPDPAGRHQRGGRDVVMDRRGDVIQHARHFDDPVLHLLFDVRLPARRRSRVGGGRHARARLPARRHRRAHDAERRRPAARRRPQPMLASTIPNCVSYDPTYRVRARGHHSGRPAPHVPGAGRRLSTTSP